MQEQKYVLYVKDVDVFFIKNLLRIKCNKTYNNGRRLTTEEFIKKAKEVHGDKYDYSKVEYKNTSTKVCIICPEHGEFWQTPNEHLQGHGCRKCSKKFS